MKPIFFSLFLFLAGMATAAAQGFDERVQALGTGSFNDRAEATALLAQTGDPRAVAVLEALKSGDLHVGKLDKKVLIGKGSGSSFKAIDPLTGQVLPGVEAGALEKIRVNNALRRAIDGALGSLTLLSEDVAVRSRAAEAIFAQPAEASVAMLDGALARESDAGVKQLMLEARAASVLSSNRPAEEKAAAIDVLAERGDRDALALLRRAANAESGNLRGAAEKAAESIENRLALWSTVQNAWYGLSLGSVLLLAAIGLAITFGVMGVINMAHGEMVMLGAYTTFVVQEVFRSYWPGGLDYSLAIAVPAAFLITGAVGVLLERGIIRFLYGRPLETLLATWGISLILQQAVRTIFGPSNREVSTPSWMSGTVEVTAGLTLTANRIAIVVFAALVFVLLIILMKRTAFGLQMRAVMQNRAMANSVGIRSNWVDAMTFGLGSAIAGIAGVALSQIDNVSPNLGQSYIIDSFLVVVFGGVGNLWGTLVGALSLGVANKFLEPYSGAVLGKILILVAVILFIQRKPRGLFPLRGRAVEG